ncbi:MAG: twin-arginine translocase TatA/TatE family subunit [Alphaproteobacteria bacterium]|nr:twin-arginine translocase TatA/TatE family subunit [Alphaproteobacteria bacterium]
MTPGPLQILLIILLVIVIFGASRVPGIAENLAKGIKAFKKGLKDEDETSPQISKKDDAE